MLASTAWVATIERFFMIVEQTEEADIPKCDVSSSHDTLLFASLRMYNFN